MNRDQLESLIDGRSPGADPRHFRFTPRSADGSTRFEMRLSTEDHKAFGRTGLAVVTDQLTGRRWRVRKAACSLPRCRCDAVAKPLDAEFDPGRKGRTT
jgi:hypothetical protein